jgi:hypothetical protein
MARSLNASVQDTVAYHGAVWTDASGYATVRLPVEAEALLPPLEYELCDLEPPSSGRVTAELKDGRFTIETDRPHVKVAWRIRGRRPTDRQPDREQEEDT